MSELAATIAAQRGPQTEFLRSPADICIYGGAAGGGKTVGLILEPLRYATRVANFTAVFFRRSTPQITNPGGLWDESQNFYPRLGGIPRNVCCSGTNQCRVRIAALLPPRPGCEHSELVDFTRVQRNATRLTWGCECADR